MIGILDVNIEELYDPPIFTEIETLKAMDILGYSPNDLKIPSISELDSLPKNAEIQSRILSELEKKRKEMINKLIKVREEVLLREQQNLQSPTIVPAQIPIPKGKKKKKKTKSKSKTIDGENDVKPTKKRIKKKAKKIKANTIDPGDLIRVRIEKIKKSQQENKIKLIKKKESIVEARVSKLQKENKEKAEKFGSLVNKKIAKKKKRKKNN